MVTSLAWVMDSRPFVSPASTTRLPFFPRLPFSLSLSLSLPFLVALFVVATGAATGCGSASMYRHKPTDPSVNQAVTAMWAQGIRSQAQSGDWILTRSYSAIGDLIALGSRGKELSHASIYDADTDTVIEAIGSGVREVPLTHLLARNRVAIVVRPNHSTTRSRQAAVERARAVVGSPFDYGGLFGFQTDEKFYCSELVVWAANLEHNGWVTTPSSLIERGTIIYSSGIREDRQVQLTAVTRFATHTALTLIRL